MRIAHVQSQYIPGQSYQENLLCYHQWRLGHKVRIFTADRILSRGRWTGMGPWSPGMYNDRGVEVLRLPLLWKSEARAQVLLKRLRSEVEQFKPDIIHLHGLWTLPTLQIITRSPRGCYGLIADDHTDDDNLNLVSCATRLRLHIFSLLFLPLLRRRVSCFASVNPFSREFLINVLNLPSDRVILLPLGIDDETYRKDEALRAQVRHRLGFRPEDVVVVTSGILDPSKGIELLLGAVAELCREHLHLRLLIVGSGEEPFMNQLRVLVEDLGLSSVVTFTGWASQEAMVGYFNAADIGVMAKKLSSVKDALAVGLPIVVPNHPSTRYFVSNQNGIAFEKGNERSLADALKTFIREPALRQEYGRRSLELVQECLSWRVIAQKSILIYENILEQRICAPRF